RKTRSACDAFGQLVQTKVLRSATDTWATTNHAFDRVGREVASVDAMGYVTVREFDAFGNLAKSTEFANALANPAAVPPGAYSTPAPSVDDRVTTFGYDRLNRKTGETR